MVVGTLANVDLRSGGDCDSGAHRLMTRRSPSNTKPLTVYMPLTLYTELCAEAWECERSISDYVRGLLTRRGKFARSIGTAGGYDLAAPLPPKIGTRAAR